MKPINLLLFAFFIAQQLSAQTLSPKQRAAGGTGSDYQTTVIPTPDGGYIVGATSQSEPSGNKKAPYYGFADYWLIQYDSKGNELWERSYGGTGGDQLISLIQTTDGGYLLAGSSDSDSSGVKLQNSKGSSDIWIVKIDNMGNIQWQKTYGGSGGDGLAAAIQTTDGGYVFCAYSSSDVSGDKTHASYGGGDYWIIKTDAAGTIQWQQTQGGGSADFPVNVAQTSDGGYFVVGYSSTLVGGTKTSFNHGPSEGGEALYDLWIVKLDKDGNKMWDKSIGGDKDDYNPNALIAAPEGGFIIGATSRSNISGNKTENSKGSDDYWILKMDENANIQWQKTIGGGDLDNLASIIKTSDGGYLVGGDSNSGLSGDKTEGNRSNTNTYDSWVVKLTGDGTLRWDKTIGGSLDEFGTKVLEVESNKYLVVNHSNSPASGDKTVPAKGGGTFDIWYTGIEYTPATIVNKVATVPAPVSNNFIVAPNPVRDVLHVQVTGQATVALFNATGKLVATKTINGNGDINVSHLPGGVYHLRNYSTGMVKDVIIIR